MTKVVLPGMLEKKKGVIVNLSSCVSGIMPPMLTGYAATKVTELKIHLKTALLISITWCASRLLMYRFFLNL